MKLALSETSKTSFLATRPIYSSDFDFELDLCLINYSVCLYFQDKIDSSEHVDKPPIVGQPTKHIQDIAPG